MTLDPAVADFIKALARANAARDIERAKRAAQPDNAQPENFRKAS